MVKINNIIFSNFRNFSEYNLSFDKKLNIFFGKNGCGKTNILEGISLIAKGRGIRNSNISNLIKKEQKNFLIKNDLEIENNTYEIEIFTEKKDNKLKKKIKVNNDQTKYSLDFLNQSISFLLFVPEMERLFQASPSYRRNFLDRLIFTDKDNYNTLINRYKKKLIERVKILQNNYVDYDWLHTIEREISSMGLEIYNLRYSQLNILNSNIDILKKDHNFKYNLNLKIKDDFFSNDISYEKYLFRLQESRQYDKKFGGTKIGPHRSDFLATINSNFEADLLSTGQQKTVVLMILLAQCNYLINYKNKNPIFLFAEIGSHLDLNNRALLLDMINSFHIQFCLNGTDSNLFSFVSTNAQFYNITES